MRAETYNFAASEATIPRLAWVALLAGALLLWAAIADYTVAVAEQERLTRQADKLQRRAQLIATARQPQPVTEKSAVAGRHTAPPFAWDLVLREIELATDRSVALLSLDTDAAQRRSRIVAEARHIDDALAFMTRLRETPLASRVLLIAHEAKRDPAGPVIGFSLQVDWSAP